MATPHKRLHIAVVTADTLAEEMAGPAIRARQIATTLSSEHDVVLATTGRADLREDRFVIESVDVRGLQRLTRWCDVMVFQGWIMAGRPFIPLSDKVLVADVYDPMHLEQLEQAKDDGDAARRLAVFNTTAVLNEQLTRADHILCASEKQRDFWLGQLAALGRINARTYDADAALRSLISVVPFGVPDEPPVSTGPAVRGVLPNIGPDDPVMIWGGGIYNWLDPLTLLEAVDRLRRDIPTVRLVFMGLRHPNPEIPTMRMGAQALALSDELGLTDVHAFFNEGWVPYDTRQNHLLEADLGVSCHLDHLETEFSFRTRILDYLWCGLPVVATAGDSFAQLIEQRDLGLTVPAGNVEELRGALRRVIEDHDFRTRCRTNVETVAHEFAWSSVLEPLVAFCRDPRRAPDLVDEEQAALVRLQVGVPPKGGLVADAKLAAHYLRAGGVRLLGARVRSRVNHLRNRRRPGREVGQR
jgi:glycosyltransferase involved in cell wall biosynthesis